MRFSHRLSLAFAAILTLSALAFFQPSIVEAECPALGYGHQNCEALQRFKDTSAHSYQEGIRYVQESAIVKGYDDGTYRPESPINRAEFTKILIIAKYGSDPAEPSEDCFPDVPRDQWFAKYVCKAKQEGILKGYPDGTFQPGNLVNFGEASKIIANSLSLSIPSENPTGYWFTPFVDALAQRKAIPPSLDTYFANVTRGEMAEMIFRIKDNRQNLASLRACDLISELCPQDDFAGYGDDLLTKVDMAKVRLSWLVWYNAARREAGLDDYRYNNDLNRSAHIWSEYAKSQGKITHKRPGQTAYYDYNMIKDWFSSLGLSFENVQRVTFTENIGSGPFRCSETDCTDELINSIRSTFDFYMAEKDKEYKPHYNSVMNEYFNDIGLGIVVDEAAGKYYLTVHYGTKVIK